MIKILFVEDDRAVRLIIRKRLEERYEIIESANGKDALKILEREHVDLLIVDVMMPVMNGYEFVEAVRGSGDITPVIMLTAMDDFTHKRQGFERGIDDYLTKPINHEELIWHIEAILRRARINAEKEIVLGDFALSEQTMCAVYKGRTFELTDKEFQLLHKLLSYPGVVFTKQQLFDDIWGYETDTDWNSIKTYISRLRSKFSDCDAFEIVSLRGIGYKAEVKSHEK